jgi:3-oxoacyl-[acyl-carrier protein] reductase
MESIGQLPGLKGKAGLVVGGGQGIGRSAARLLAAQGVRIALVDLDNDRVRATSEELHGLGMCIDVQEPGAARGAVEEATAHLGGLDILVNVVGKGMLSAAADVSAEMQRGVLERNYLHHVEFCSAFAQAALNAGRPGVITMVSSLAGMAPFPNQAAYGAAKAALNSYSATLSVELAPKQIRVNTVAPGVVRTDRNTLEREQHRELIAAIPMGRFADQSEVGAVIVFLCSDLASYITGQIIVVDGGASHYLRFWRD